jgi:hypothetical protein
MVPTTRLDDTYTSTSAGSNSVRLTVKCEGVRRSENGAEDGGFVSEGGRQQTFR